MKKPANDILDTCKINPVEFSAFVMPKLNKKSCLRYFANLCLIFALFLFTSFEPDRIQSNGQMKVVIDAGHGGHDPGCLGKKSKEKDIALGISLKLGKYIEDHYSDVKVIYTRKSDQFLELHERAEIANNAKADLFICIHCNSACFFDRKKKKEMCNSEIAGVESWVMGLNKSEANLEVAKRENEVILLEKDYTKQYGGFDPNSPEANILFSLYQNSYLDQSLRIASLVQQEMKVIGRSGRGVKQAGFLVLYKTSMPSILIETGFLSNAAEEKFLLSQKGQDQLARSIFNAFKSYKSSVQQIKSERAEDVPVDTPPVKKEAEEKKFGTLLNLGDSAPEVSSPANSKKSEVIVTSKDTLKSGVKTQEKKPLDTKTTPVSNDVVLWSVQFYTSPKPLSDNHKIYKEFNDVKEYFENGMYKYSVGLLTERSEAGKLQSKLRQQGYKDAFVIAFLNDRKISIKEATEKSIKK